MRQTWWQLLVTIDQIAALLSNWVILSSFIEADWWHFTDPRTTGVSIPGVLVLFGSFCLTPFLLCSKKIRLYRPKALCKSILKLAPSTLLFLSSLPLFREPSWCRTGVLGLAVAVLPLTIAWVLCDPLEIFPREEISNKTTVSLLNNAPRFESIAKDTTIRKIGHCRTERVVEITFLLAIMVNMCVRYCSGSINVFYENWAFSLGLLLVNFSLSMLKLTVRSQVLFEADCCVPRKNPSVPDSCPDNSSLINKLNSTTQTDLNTSNCSNSSISKLCKASSIIKNNENETFYKNYAGNPESYQRQQTAKRSHLIWISASGCIQGFSVGVLLVLFLWFFITPTLLCRWSDITQYEAGSYVILAFALSIFIVIVCRPKRMSISLLSATSSSTTNQKFVVWLGCACGILIALLIVATALLLGTHNYPALLGSLTLCLTLPYIFSINVLSISRIVMLANCDVSLARTFPALPGFIAFFASFGFVITHLFLVLFINPQLTPMFLGHMDLILTFIISILFLSIVAFVVTSVLLKPTLDGVVASSQKRPISKRLKKMQKNIVKHKLFFILGFLDLILLIVTVCVGPQFNSGHCVSCYSEAIANVRASNSQTGVFQNDTFSVLTWNVLLGHDVHGRDNLPCLGKIINEINPNLIGIEESEALAPYWGGKDVLGYLSGYLKIKSYPGVEPLKASLGVGVLSRLPVTEHQSHILPAGESERLPHYSLVKVQCDFQNQTITIIDVHAVFKNWSATGRDRSPFANTSASQIAFIAQLAGYNHSPTIIMGDFNLNPNEPELDILYNMGFNNTLHPGRTLAPPSSITNRFAVVDHIFYRGLVLKSSRIVAETQSISDHHPVVAYFQLPT